MSPRMPVYYGFRSYSPPYRRSRRRPALKYTPVKVYAKTNVTFFGLTTVEEHNVHSNFMGYFHNLEVVA